MHTPSQRNSRRRRERGQTLAEFAMIAPLFILLIFGVIDIARLYQSWVTIQHGAREGARYGVTGREDCDLASPTREACIEEIVRHQTQGLTNTDSLVVTFRAWEYPDYSNPPTEGTAGEQCDALEVKVDFDFTPATPLLGNIFGPVTMTARERLVNEPFGPCNTS